MSKRKNERTDERTNERTSERARERASEPASERATTLTEATKTKGKYVLRTFPNIHERKRMFTNIYEHFSTESEQNTMSERPNERTSERGEARRGEICFTNIPEHSRTKTNVYEHLRTFTNIPSPPIPRHTTHTTPI